MRGTIHGILLTALAVAVGPVGAAITPSIYDAGDGWSPHGQVWFGKVRNLASTNGDWEVGVGTDASKPKATTDAKWPSSGAISDFRLSYTASESLITLSFNGSTASMSRPDGAYNALTLQLVARHTGNKTARLDLGDLVFNGSAITPGDAARYFTADSSASSASYITLASDAFDGTADWSLSGKVQACWKGPAPSRDHTRLDFVGSNIQAIGEPIPAPGAIASLALTALLGVRPRRPT